MRLAAPLALAVALVALAGCSGDDGVVPEQDEQGRYVIRVLGTNEFEPQVARVPAGATVVWVVEGGFHDVNEEDGLFSSNDGRPLDERGYPTLLGPGEEFAYTAGETGSFRYWCHTHHEQDMWGRLVVE